MVTASLIITSLLAGGSPSYRGSDRSYRSGDRSFRGADFQNDVKSLGLRSIQRSSQAAAAMYETDSSQLLRKYSKGKIPLGQRKNTAYGSIRARLNWQNAVRLVRPSPFNPSTYAMNVGNEIRVCYIGYPLLSINGQRASACAFFNSHVNIHIGWHFLSALNGCWYAKIHPRSFLPTICGVRLRSMNVVLSPSTTFTRG